LKLKVYNLIESTKVLGPFSRFGLWTQGCPFRCKNCMTPDSIDRDGGIEIDIKELGKYILSFDNEGITISGGEPFIQSEALYELLRFIKYYRDMGVIVYSGYQYEDLKGDRLLELIDILIDGPYVDELNDGIALRGSSNQRVIFLTDRYKNFKDMYNQKKREIEIIADINLQIIGIPSKKILKRFRDGICNK